MTLTAPEPLERRHAIASFDSGVPILDDWLKRRALANEASGASRTYVVPETEGVAGYYSLAAAAIALSDASGSLRRNMPDPIPMVLLGRLAVSRARQNQGLGAALLLDAMQKAGLVSQRIGIRGVMVHALSEPAKAFYARHGFAASPKHPMTLVLSIERFSPSS